MKEKEERLLSVAISLFNLLGQLSVAKGVERKNTIAAWDNYREYASNFLKDYRNG